MSPPVLIGFAGVLVAAVATGMLAGRCVRQPRIDLIVWTAATLVLTIALVAQSMGFASGFGPVTFRAVQLFALLLVPLWLAWGLVELVVANEAARFGMRLVSGALTVVASVILATDPLTAQPFSKSWPLASSHFQPISLYAMDVVQAVAVVAVLVSAAMAAAQAGRDPRWRAAMTAVAPVGLAVLMTVALRLSLPAKAAYPLLSMLAAALVWFGVSRVAEPPWRTARHDGVRDRRRDGVRNGRGRDRSGDRPDDDYWPDDTYGSADVPDGQYATYGPRDGRPGPGRPRGSGDIPGAGPAARSANGRDQGRRVNPGPRPPMAERQDRYRGSGPGRPGGLGPDERPPGTQALRTPGALGGLGTEAPLAGAALAGAALAGAALAGAEFAPQASAGGSPAATPARPYGRILIFTLLDDRVADFDRLAEQTAEEIRTGEPDTLVYVIHLVPNAPMQRIFYEIYRDRAAFESHESQPYMQRFVTERRSCVLATNVIELRLKYAKVAPLPNPRASVPALPAVPPPAARAQLPPGPPPRPQPSPPGPPGPPAGPRGLPGASGPQGTQRLQPLPPARPQRPDQRRPDQPRPDQPRPDQPRPDQRQAPPAGRPYRG
jgi:quinol monooxygenase YgiN